MSKLQRRHVALNQLLDRPQTIIRESPASGKLIITAVQSTTWTNPGMTCYRCNGHGQRPLGQRTQEAKNTQAVQPEETHDLGLLGK